jgi:hypothetical protein
MDNETKSKWAETLRQMLLALAQLGQEPQCVGPKGWGVPVSHLLSDNVERVVNYFLSSDHGEYRLNGAGLKLHACWLRNDDGERVIRMRVGGDQADQYRKYVEQANALLKERGLQPEY